jgi:hypothetical protein
MNDNFLLQTTPSYVVRERVWIAQKIRRFRSRFSRFNECRYTNFTKNFSPVDKITECLSASQDKLFRFKMFAFPSQQMNENWLQSTFSFMFKCIFHKVSFKTINNFPASENESRYIFFPFSLVFYIPWELNWIFLSLRSIWNVSGERTVVALLRFKVKFWVVN